MMDNFERLKEALERDAPPPDPEARQATLTTAMTRFQKQNAARHQGITAHARPISSDGTGPSSIWSKIMHALKPSRSGWTPVLAGSASLAVLMLAVISTGVIRPDLFERRDIASPPMGRPASVEADEAADAVALPEERPEQDFFARDAAQPSSPQAEVFGQSAQRSLPAPSVQPAPSALGFSRGADQFAPRARMSQGAL